MTISSKTLDAAGNQVVADGVTLAYDSMTNVAVASSLQPSVIVSSIAPTFSAPKGTLCIALNGSSATTRMFINTNGTTGWTSVTTAT